MLAQLTLAMLPPPTPTLDAHGLYSQAVLRVSTHASDDVVVKVFIDKTKEQGWSKSLMSAAAVALLQEAGLQVTVEFDKYSSVVSSVFTFITRFPRASIMHCSA